MHTATATTTPTRSGSRTVVRIDAAATQVGETTTLHPTTFSIASGTIVGIAGGSGAGKTTLLETIAGIRPLSSGEVTRSERSAFVPQEDIIHRDLPLRRTLIHAASLRIADRDAAGRAQVVDRALDRLDLAEQGAITVADLSGGQRKRASLAAEMLTDAKLLFLDEPTSGLDPAMAADLMRSLRQLAETGSAIVMTTHAPSDLSRCDVVVFVARGGHVAFVGTPEDAKTHFGVENLVEVYERINERSTEQPVVLQPAAPATSSDTEQPPAAGSWSQQWRSLVARNMELVRSNRLTLAILCGSPVFIIAMMAMLFPAGAFDAGAPSGALAVQILFWMAFNSFFFGLTYGLLQVVGEFEIVRRERRIGLRLSAYVASKLAVLVPILAIVNAAQLATLEITDRLGELGWSERLGLFTSLQLLSSAAVVLGLHASSAVRNSSQATLALPMLCFPQILFAGAVVPVSAMGWLPEFMSVPLASRWGFESAGRIIELSDAAAREPGTAGFVESFSGSPTTGWAVLASLTLAGCAGTIHTLRRRTAPGFMG